MFEYRSGFCEGVLSEEYICVKISTALLISKSLHSVNGIYFQKIKPGLQ